jgi:DNA-binding protein HU-beta
MRVTNDTPGADVNGNTTTHDAMMSSDNIASGAKSASTDNPPSKFPRQANKGSLAERIADELGVPRRSATRILDAVLDSIRDLLRDNRRVAVKGFGTFDCRKRKGRAYKHPVSGKSIEVADKDTILFRPSDQLIEDTREGSKAKPRDRQPLSSDGSLSGNPLLRD